HRASPGASPAPRDLEIALGAPALQPVRDLDHTRGAAARRHRGQRADRGQASGRGGCARLGDEDPFPLVLARPPRPASPVSRPGDRPARGRGARRVLRVSARTQRLLTLMGSGETAPTMVTTHREVVARFGDAAPRAVLLDTPYGFQENAAEITQRAIEYFGHRVQLAIEAAGFLGPLAVDLAQRTPLAETAALSRL